MSQPFRVFAATTNAIQDARAPTDSTREVLNMNVDLLKTSRTTSIGRLGVHQCDAKIPTTLYSVEHDLVE